MSNNTSQLDILSSTPASPVVGRSSNAKTIAGDSSETSFKEVIDRSNNSHGKTRLNNEDVGEKSLKNNSVDKLDTPKNDTPIDKVNSATKEQLTEELAAEQDQLDALIDVSGAVDTLEDDSSKILQLDLPLASAPINGEQAAVVGTASGDVLPPPPVGQNLTGHSQTESNSRNLINELRNSPQQTIVVENSGAKNVGKNAELPSQTELAPTVKLSSPESGASDSFSFNSDSKVRAETSLLPEANSDSKIKTPSIHSSTITDTLTKPAPTPFQGPNTITTGELSNTDIKLRSPGEIISLATDEAVDAKALTDSVTVNDKTPSSKSDTNWIQQLNQVNGFGQASKSGVMQLQLPVNVGNAQWFSAMADRISWLANQNIQAADIQLDPPELGPLQVRISVSHDQASVNFVSHQPSVRETLDSQLMRLRELFSNEGLNLVDVNVSDRHQQNQGQGHQDSSAVMGSSDEGLEQEKVDIPVTEITSWVDYYV